MTMAPEVDLCPPISPSVAAATLAAGTPRQRREALRTIGDSSPFTAPELVEATLASSLPPVARRWTVIRVLGLEAKSIAESEGVSKQMVAKTLQGPGHGRSQRVEAACAHAVSVAAGFEITPERFFPEYSAGGAQ